MEIIYSLLMVTARVSTPILLAATGAIYSEKSGLSNIALDAAMIMGAFMAVYGSFFYGNSWVGVFYAILVGLVIGLAYAGICVYLHGDNTVVGIAFNLIGWGLTTFLLPVIYGTTGSFVSENNHSCFIFCTDSGRDFYQSNLGHLFFLDFCSIDSFCSFSDQKRDDYPGCRREPSGGRNGRIQCEAY